MPSVRSRTAALAAALVLMGGGAMAQNTEALSRGMSHEEAERFREAAVAYREALVAEPANLSALLGLERAYASLGTTDSLLPVLERALTARPQEPTIRAMQLRAFRMLADQVRMREAFEQWVVASPGQVAPYREYTRLLLQNAQTAAADSVLRRAASALGSARGMELELAQLRAAMGLWESSAEAWRNAVSDAAYLEQAAVFALLPAPADARERIRAVLLAPPVQTGARRIIGALELEWGSPRAGWNALRTLPGDTASVRAWLDFARRAEEAQAWLVARDALAAVHARTRAPEHALRAATAALNGGDSRSALTLAASAGDRRSAAQAMLPVELRALAALGRPADAEQRLQAARAELAPDQIPPLARIVAMGWIRAGDLARARALLGERGEWEEEPIAGWIALYEGDLRTARRRLRPRGGDVEPELVQALALLSRTKADTAPAIGAAFLALARADTGAAAAAFEVASRSVPDAATLLLASAARLHGARGDDARAIPIWRSLLGVYPTAPEAPEAELEWARSLRRGGDPAAAIARLEHLILTYPTSALVPQARRELELARATVPPTP
jgi:tetratricopeptide (TPR) repeat protein